MPAHRAVQTLTLQCVYPRKISLHGKVSHINSFTSESIHTAQLREVSASIFHFLVLGATLLRLIHRWRTRKIWWEDYTVCIVLLVDTILVILTWLRFRFGGKHTHFTPKWLWQYFVVHDIITGKVQGFIYSAWLSAAMAWAVIWWLFYFSFISQAYWHHSTRGSRFSLCLLLARIFPENHFFRRFSFVLSITFSLSYVAFLLV